MDTWSILNSVAKHMLYADRVTFVPQFGFQERDSLILWMNGGALGRDLIQKDEQSFSATTI